MKTTNLKMDLMVPLQVNKDIVFNESMIKIDNFINLTVKAFSKDEPQDIKNGEKYIITGDKNTNKICYKPLASKQSAYQEPAEGMMVYVMQNGCFFIFSNSVWQRVHWQQQQSSFVTVEDVYNIPHDQQNHYLYLTKDIAIPDIKSSFDEITIIIKQSTSNKYKVTWSEKILWENKAAHVMNMQNNTIDLIKLYRVAGEAFFLGKILGQNFSY